MNSSDGGEKKPGYMFDSASESLGMLSKDRQQEIQSIKGRQRLIRLVVGFMGGLTILIISISLFGLFTSSYSNVEEEVDLPVAPEVLTVADDEESVAEKTPPPTPVATVRSGMLTLGEVVKPPADTPVEELNMAELRGVFKSDESGAARLFMALREVDRRKPTDLVAIYSLALDNDSYLLRRQVVKLLSRTSDSGADALLMKMLSDSDPGVRRDAAQALGTLGSRAALGYIHARLKKEENKEVKESLIKSIERINGFPLSAKEREELQ